MRYSISIDSSELSRQLRKAVQRNPRVTAGKVTDIVLDLAGRSSRMAPVDIGDLRDNCTAVVNDKKIFENQHITGEAAPSARLEATVGYSLPYALRQHEELSYNHPKGGQAKFLEKPYLEKEQDYINALKSIPEEVIG